MANGIVGRAEPVGGGRAEATPRMTSPRPTRGSPPPTRRWTAGDFAAAEDEFDKLLQANPADAEAQAGKAQAGLFARAAALDPQADAGRGAATDDDRAGPAGRGRRRAGHRRRRRGLRPADRGDQAGGGDERNQVRVRLLELFETLGNTDERVLKARRDLMTALF